MKFYIIAGEASGDLHASNLVKAIKSAQPNAEFRGWGGDLMRAQGVDLVRHIEDLSFMGFSEVVMNIKTILNNISFCKSDIRNYSPEAIILIDYPGFNLRIAPFAKALGIKVLFYISPQVWAWKSSRVKAIKKHVDRMFVILPFEKDFYADYGYDVEFVGHPLLDALPEAKEIQLTEKRVAILPGSRKQEITKMLPIMLSVVDRFSEYEFVIAGAPSIKESFYKGFISGSRVRIEYGNTYGVLQSSSAAMVTSGTATLETALLGIPEVVCYKGSPISYQIAKRLINLSYISLVNLILDKPAVKELIQSELNQKSLGNELDRLLNDSNYMKGMVKDYTELRIVLGNSGASEKCAEEMLKTLNNS